MGIFLYAFQLQLLFAETFSEVISMTKSLFQFNINQINWEGVRRRSEKANWGGKFPRRSMKMKRKIIVLSTEKRHLQKCGWMQSQKQCRNKWNKTFRNFVPRQNLKPKHIEKLCSLKEHVNIRVFQNNESLKRVWALDGCRIQGKLRKF